MRCARIVQRGTFRNFRRGASEPAVFIIVIFGFGRGATFASGPFQMLFGSTIKMTTTPAHVTLPGLMGNRISAPYPL
jgi:hypothetical protein